MGQVISRSAERTFVLWNHSNVFQRSSVGKSLYSIKHLQGVSRFADATQGIRHYKCMHDDWLLSCIHFPTCAYMFTFIFVGQDVLFLIFGFHVLFFNSAFTCTADLAPLRCRSNGSHAGADGVCWCVLLEHWWWENHWEARSTTTICRILKTFLTCLSWLPLTWRCHDRCWTLSAAAFPQRNVCNAPWRTAERCWKIELHILQMFCSLLLMSFRVVLSHRPVQFSEVSKL